MGVEGWVLVHPHRPEWSTRTSEEGHCNRNQASHSAQQQAEAQSAKGGGPRRAAARRRPLRRRPPRRPRAPPLAARSRAPARLGSFRRRRRHALPRALQHLRQFPSGSSRLAIFLTPLVCLASCVARFL